MKFLSDNIALSFLREEYDKYNSFIVAKDSPLEPYKSKYEAMKCLDNMKVLLYYIQIIILVHVYINKFLLTWFVHIYVFKYL